MKTYTTQDIRRMLELSNTAVERAVLALYERQTAAEQAAHATAEHNQQGFNAFDAEILTSFAEQLKGIGTYQDGTPRRLPRRLTDKQLAIARKKVLKYAAQLSVMANSRVAPDADPDAIPELPTHRVQPSTHHEVDHPAVPVIKPPVSNDADWEALGSALAGFNSRGERWHRGGFKTMRAGVRI